MTDESPDGQESPSSPQESPQKTPVASDGLASIAIMLLAVVLIIFLITRIVS